MRILILLLTLFFSTTAFSVERLLCEIDKELPGRLFKLQISDFINSEKFTPEVEEEFELLKYSFQNIFWLEYDTQKKITEQEIKLRDRRGYFEINKNIFGQYKSLRVPFNEDVIPLLKKTDGSLRFRAWPHRETHGRADIIVEIDRIDPYIRVSSMKFNKFFGKDYGHSIIEEIILGWHCELANNKF